VLISKPPQAAVVKAMVVNVAEKSDKISDRQVERGEAASEPLQKCRKPIRRCQNRGVTLVGACQEFRQGCASLFFVSFFVDLKARFFVPTPRFRLRRRAQELFKVGRRTNLAALLPPLPGHTLTASSTTHACAIGMRFRGEPAFGRDQSRHNLVFGGCKNPTMMRRCASAAKLETATHSSSRHDSHESPRDPATSKPSSATPSQWTD